MFRRALVLLLAMTFAGSSPAAAGCAMGIAHEPSAEEGASPHSHHDHGAAEAATAPDRSEQEHTGPGGCGVMMVCAAAAPAAQPGVASTVPAAAEVRTSAIARTYSSPAVAFEPPPPRWADLI